jgi:hypothetical protein
VDILVGVEEVLVASRLHLKAHGIEGGHGKPPSLLGVHDAPVLGYRQDARCRRL